MIGGALMTGGALVSIVVPTYERASLLPRMIRSVVGQTYGDWELLIVDGGSRDGTADVVKGFAAGSGGRIRFMEAAGSGCCEARNLGIEASRGEFVAFLDSDDEFLPRKLERQMALFRERADLGLVYSDYAAIDLGGRRIESVMAEQCPVGRSVPMLSVGEGLWVCGEDFFEYLIQEYFIATIVGVVRREVLGDGIRFLENDLYGCEWLFYLEIARRARVGFVDEGLCLHHWVAGSLARSDPTRNMIYHRRLLKTMLDRFREASPPARGHMRRQLAAACRQLGMEAYKADEFEPALRYFGEALRASPDGRTAVHWGQSMVRRLAARGREGRAPMLRFDPYRASDGV